MATLIESDMFHPSAGFFNVDDRVGLGLRNLKQDVKLVQVLLRIVYFHPDLIPNEIRPIMPLKPDGICGPRTHKSILTFQQDPAGPFFQHMVVDGIVDSTPGEFATTQIHSRTFTIFALGLTARGRNSDMYAQLMSLGPDMMADLMLNPAFL